MKFRVTMKTPDALARTITDAVLDAIPFTGDSETDYCNHEGAILAAERLCGRWFRDGEYLTVEIDTDAQTCVVVPVETERSVPDRKPWHVHGEIM